MKEQDQGASADADRASQAPPQAPSGLGHTVTIPCAWQPIETAPKDGLGFVIVSDGIHVEPAFYDRYQGRWCDIHAEARRIPQPTHWMPLPNPPFHTPSAPQAAPSST